MTARPTVLARRSARRAACLVLALWPVWGAAEPLVLAAASTSAAMDAALAASASDAVTSYGASGNLARQIEQGAPGDLFLSANPKWMQHLVDGGLIAPDDVQVLMSNRLVLIAPEGTGSLTPETIGATVEDELFVMSDPKTAPVGTYGQAALESLGLWDALSAAFVPTRNTIATVAAVARGEAALGLVYASDAAGAPGVEVVWEIPAESHPPIRYLIAPLDQGQDEAGAAAFMAFLLSEQGSDVLRLHGFLPLGEG